MFFSALTAVAKTSKTMWNSSGESGCPCLVLDFRENAFHFSPLKIMFAVGLSYIAFIMLRYVPSIPAFWRVFFNHKWMLNFVKGFLWIYWDNHMVLIFQFVNVVYYIDWFADIEESLHPWDKATWSWYMIFLMCCWGWCTETTQRDGTRREEEGGFRMGNTCILVADSCWMYGKNH